MGLNRYGPGDLDGALLVWEQALAIDPENAQANSYVDYVRLNYDILTSSRARAGARAGLRARRGARVPDRDQPGELPAPDAPVHMDPLDDGWFIERETRDANSSTASTSRHDARAQAQRARER